MDQYLIAMAAVVAFLGVMVGYVIATERRSRRSFEPTETGIEDHVFIRGGNYIPKTMHVDGTPPKPRKK